MICKLVEQVLLYVAKAQMKKDLLRDLKIQSGVAIDLFQVLDLFRRLDKRDSEGLYASSVLSYAPAFGSVVELVKDGWHFLEYGPQHGEIYCVVRTPLEPPFLFYEEVDDLWRLSPSWDPTSFEDHYVGDYNGCLDKLGLNEAFPLTGRDEDMYAFFCEKCLTYVRMFQMGSLDDWIRNDSVW